MDYTLRIRPAAEADIQDAYHYYEKCRKGLGSDFIRCIEAALEKITLHPTHYPVVHKNIHRILVQRFPFAIFFVV